uniref:Uncharacterized protein n=1 Tax=Rhizophora mucronata TaxID=61149 RepID=A0A2P2JHE5_RHIMU
MLCSREWHCNILSPTCSNWCSIWLLLIAKGVTPTTSLWNQEGFHSKANNVWKALGFC